MSRQHRNKSRRRKPLKRIDAPIPEAFVDSARDWLGDESEAFLEALLASPRIGLRRNPLRPQIDLDHELAPVAWCASGGVLPTDCKWRPGKSVAWAAGAFYLQEPAAMLPAEILAAQPGEWILDLCAAPGGKSTHIAGQLAGEGLLVANEPDARRARTLVDNLEQAGVGNAIVTIESPDRLANTWGQTFDAVLVDAPCSGEAMFGKHVAARQAWSREFVDGCANRQKQILKEAASLVLPGGRIVYATCAFSPTENEEVIGWFLDNHPDFRLHAVRLPEVDGSLPETCIQGCARIWPHRAPALGQFAALLVDSRTSEPTRVVSGPPGESLSIADQRTVDSWLGSELASKVRVANDNYFLPPAELPPYLNELRLARIGIAAADRVGRTLRPHHAAATAAALQGQRERIDLDDQDAKQWLQGRELSVERPSGWYVPTWHDLPLGWGKASSGRLKNHLPKFRRS